VPGGKGMNYGQIIGQAWQIIKRTKVILFIGLINVLMPFLLINQPKNLGMSCLALILLIPYFLILIFSPYAIIISTEKVLQAETPRLSEIWGSFKKIFWRLILLEIIFLVPILIVLYFLWFIQNAILNALGLVIANSQSQTFRISILTSFFVIGLMNYCYYGLIFHKMGVIRSFQHGIKVFAANWLSSVILVVLIQSPLYIAYFIEWLLVSTQTPPSLSTAFFAAIYNFPYNLLNAIISAPIGIFIPICFLLAYHRIIQDFDRLTFEFLF
jgi:hypothetical protein